MIGHRLKLSLQTVSKGFGFLRVWESDSPRGDQGGRRSDLTSQVQAVSFYLVRCVGVSSVIGQNILSCDWSE